MRPFLHTVTTPPHSLHLLRNLLRAPPNPVQECSRLRVETHKHKLQSRKGQSRKAGRARHVRSSTPGVAWCASSARPRGNHLSPGSAQHPCRRPRVRGRRRGGRREAPVRGAGQSKASDLGLATPRRSEWAGQSCFAGRHRRYHFCSIVRESISNPYALQPPLRHRAPP